VNAALAATIGANQLQHPEGCQSSRVVPLEGRESYEFKGLSQLNSGNRGTSAERFATWLRNAEGSRLIRRAAHFRHTAWAGSAALKLAGLLDGFAGIEIAATMRVGGNRPVEAV
jgi:hypothetical protein